MRSLLFFAVLASLVTTASADAYAAPATTTDPPQGDGAVAMPAPPAPAPYSLPWQLRGLPAATFLRSDTTASLYEDTASRHGQTIASLLTASFRIPHTGPPTEGLAVFARGTIVQNHAPAGPSGFAIVNPLVGGVYAMKFDGGYRLNLSVSATVPVGMGGGSAPDQRGLQARLAGPQNRSQLDGSLFAVDDLAIITGIGAGWVDLGWTVQVEATFFQLTRVRGEANQAELSKTNSTFGLHIGYFVVPNLSVGAEVRYQRWINPPLNVEADPTHASVDNLTAAIGPRAHFKVGDQLWLRPGVSYARGLDHPMAAASPNVHILQLDIPFFF